MRKSIVPRMLDVAAPTMADRNRDAPSAAANHSRYAPFMPRSDDGLSRDLCTLHLMLEDGLDDLHNRLYHEQSSTEVQQCVLELRIALEILGTLPYKQENRDYADDSRSEMEGDVLDSCYNTVSCAEGSAGRDVLRKRGIGAARKGDHGKSPSESDFLFHFIFEKS